MENQIEKIFYQHIINHPIQIKHILNNWSKDEVFLPSLLKRYQSPTFKETSYMHSLVVSL